MLNRVALVLLISFFSSLLIFSHAEARRFGGGTSFGHHSYTSSSSSSSPSRTQSFGSQASRPSLLGSAMTGLAIGGIMGYLFSGHGLGGSLGWIFLIIAGIWLIRKLFQGLQMSPAANQTSTTSSSQVQKLTPNFDQGIFLREAKGLFVRLQAANDARNLADIREFTTPEVFTEISMQFQERRNEVDVTEVIQLDAEWLDCYRQDNAVYITIRFAGMIRETAGDQAQAFHETWIFRQGVTGQWLVAGIEQN